ncbi:hypothetical protein GUJ93_ZPchr0004g40030 [Zizania palustris]|uniref:Uncharacterized protein n=1 Tax=Zizania palustris TaxID=103762 RepID=A0A8J5VP49_ZIZPA|nr:hypothetical protein GUJ93_ZPchr0004g40030 [Zizania palustris]
MEVEVEEMCIVLLHSTRAWRSGSVAKRAAWVAEAQTVCITRGCHSWGSPSSTGSSAMTTPSSSLLRRKFMLGVLRYGEITSEYVMMSPAFNSPFAGDEGGNQEKQEQQAETEHRGVILGLLLEALLPELKL